MFFIHVYASHCVTAIMIRRRMIKAIKTHNTVSDLPFDGCLLMIAGILFYLS